MGISVVSAGDKELLLERKGKKRKEKDATRRGLGERKAFIGDFLGRRVVDGFAR